MAQFFVEDAAHDAVLKTIHYSKPEILICSGKAKVISRTLGEQKSIGLIDEDNSAARPELKEAKWKKEDDFTYAALGSNLFIRFSKNVEEWLVRIAAESKTTLPGNSPRFHGQIKSENHTARKFLETLRDSSKNSPFELLRKIIKEHLEK